MKNVKELFRDDQSKEAVFLRSPNELIIMERLPIELSVESYLLALDFDSDNQTDIVENGIYKWGRIGDHTKFTVIKPADPLHIQKYSSKQEDQGVLFVETMEHYNLTVLKWIINTQIQRTTWIDDIFTGKAEADRVIYADDQIVILPDMKDDRFKLLLFKDHLMRSLRDLDGSHIPLLEMCLQMIRQLMDPNGNKMAVYFHYPPTFYRLHLHIIPVECIKSASSHVYLAHPIEQVIQNLSLCGDYYQRASLALLTRAGYPLCPDDSDKIDSENKK